MKQILTKVCTKCNVEKEFSEFHKDKRGKYGVKAQCKVCTNQQSRQWQSDNKEAKAEYDKQYRLNNKRARAEYRKQWGLENKEAEAEYHKQHYFDNKEARIEYSKQWALDNPDKVNAKAAKRRSMKLQATAWGQSQKSEIESLYEAAKKFESITGYPIHIDHIIPLTNDLVCGLHVAENLQLMFAKQNISKSNSFDPDRNQTKEQPTMHPNAKNIVGFLGTLDRLQSNNHRLTA